MPRPVSRDIETTSIGTDTTADKIAAAGIIVAALNNKQNTVIGTDDWVMTGSPYDGGYGGKPVYSTTNNYSNALVTAETVNNAAIAAANSEFSCDLYVEGAEQIPDNCLIWRIRTTGPETLPTPRLSVSDPTIPSPSAYRCARNLDGTYVNVRCDTDTVNYLGANNSKSGKWGMQMPDGFMSGKSVCSTILPDSALSYPPATDEQAAILDAEYAAQAGVGNAPGFYCWCKMENPAVSKWIYAISKQNIAKCEAECASHCFGMVSGYIDFKTNMFGVPYNE